MDYRVLTYDGYKGAERPRAIQAKGETLTVVEVEDAWVAAGVDPESATTHTFVVRCEAGERFRAVYDPDTGWQVSPLPSLPLKKTR